MKPLVLILPCCLLIASLYANAEDAVEPSAQTCEACVGVASNLRSFLLRSSSSAVDTVTLQERFCGAHPAAGQRLCWELLGRGLPSLALKLQSPSLVCADVGLCSQAQSLAKPEGANDMSCPYCEYLVFMLQLKMDDPATEEEVLVQAEQVCTGLPQEAQATCIQYVAEYGKQLYAWVHTAVPEEVCTDVGICDRTARLPALPPPLRSAAAKLLVLRDDDQCNTCQLVVIEASSVLSDPATQKQILDYVKQSCDDFEAFKQQCEDYVDLYGPTVLTMAKQYLKPELCTQLGFCPAAALQDLPFTA